MAGKTAFALKDVSDEDRDDRKTPSGRARAKLGEWVKKNHAKLVELDAEGRSEAIQKQYQGFYDEEPKTRGLAASTLIANALKGFKVRK